MERNLMVAGFGGQGVMLLGKMLSYATCEATDKNVTFFPSYGAEQRGGTANCYVVISDEEVGAPLGDALDDLLMRVMRVRKVKRRLAQLDGKHREQREENGCAVHDDGDRLPRHGDGIEAVGGKVQAHAHQQNGGLVTHNLQ